MFWPEEFHGLDSPWGHIESDTTERLSLSNRLKKNLLIFLTPHKKRKKKTLASVYTQILSAERKSDVEVTIETQKLHCFVLWGSSLPNS